MGEGVWGWVSAAFLLTISGEFLANWEIFLTHAQIREALPL